MKPLLLFLMLLMPVAAVFAEGDFQPQTLALVNARLSGNELKLMVARTEKEKSKGLMFYDFLEANHGMLFVYNAPQIMSFWMFNTKIPLDIVFFSESLKVVDMISFMKPGYGKPQYSLPVYTSSVEAQYALELNRGAIRALNIKLGDTLYIPLAVLYSSD